MRAAKAVELGVRRRDSNDRGRTLMLLAVIGVSGALGIPFWQKAVPTAATGWEFDVLNWVWVLYGVFILISIIGGIVWLVRRPVA